MAVLRAATAELLADLDVGEGLPPDERLRVGLDAFMRYIEQHPASYQAVVRRAGSDERLLEVFEDTRTAVVEHRRRHAGPVRAAPRPAAGHPGLDRHGRGVRPPLAVRRPVPREELVEFLRRAALTMLPDALLAFSVREPT